MTVKVDLRALTPEEQVSRKVLRLNDVALDQTTVEEGLARGLTNISKYLDENREGLANTVTHKGRKPGDVRVISDVGYRAIHTTPGSVFQLVPPREGSYRKRVDGVVPTIFTMHSFGGGLDRRALDKNRGVKSIAVDPATGHNPHRYYNGIKELISSDRGVSVHQIVSRRGDLTNSAPWDCLAYHGSGPVAKAAGVSGIIHQVTVGVELEEHWIRHDNERKMQSARNRVPYTEEQYEVIAFLLKKYISWTNNADILKWLGPSASAVDGIKNNQTGMVNHQAFNPAHNDPSAEFQYPVGFVKGDPLPSHLLKLKKRNLERIELFWGEVPDGTKLSAWDRIFDKVARIRDFDPATEVFDQNLARSRIKLEVPHQIGGTHIAGLAKMAARDKVAAFKRAEDMAGMSRAQLHDSGQVHYSAVALAHQEGSARMSGAATAAAAKLTVIHGAVGFDFAKAKWVTKDTINRPSDAPNSSGGA